MVRWWRQGLAAIATVGALAIPATGSTPVLPPPTPAALETYLRAYEEEVMYDLKRLPVPQGRHRVFVHYDRTAHAETEPFHKHEDRIFNGVTQLYAKHDIDVQFLRYVPFRPDTNRVLLRVIDEDQYRTTVPTHQHHRIFSSGYADVKQRTAYLKGWETDVEFEKKWTNEFISISIDMIAHEIGHLLLLPHASAEFLNHQTRNLMFENIGLIDTCADHCTDITDEEARIIHSYLGKKQIYDAYTAAGDFIPYTLKLDAVKMAAHSANTPRTR